MNFLMLLVTLLLLLTVKSSFGQILDKTEREFFILGTLGDYMGRSGNSRDQNLLDRYDGLQGPLVILIDSLLAIDYPRSMYRVERYVDSAQKPLSEKIYSDSLAKNLTRITLLKRGNIVLNAMGY